MENNTTTATRIMCEHTRRLIATIDGTGVRVWCKYEKTSELIPWDVIDAAREKSHEQQKQAEQQAAC